jgi:hypothetical protein
MTFILDMASGKEYGDKESSCPNQRTENTQLAGTARDDDYPPLQLATVEATASGQQPASALPGHELDSLLQIIED